MKKIITGSLIIVLVALMSTACSNSNNNGISDKKIVEIATKAYVFGYPMILMDYTKKVATNVETPTTNGYAPVNQLGHFRMFPNDKFTAVVKPNVDTYYSNAWFDLRTEPIVFTVPATETYYLLPLYDAYSNVFAVPGPRTTGTGAHTFLLTSPFWKGDVPEGMEQIKAPTNTVWLVGRTQVNSAEDGATVVRAFQDGMKVDLLSKYGTDYQPPLGKVSAEKSKIVPVDDTRKLSFEDYINKMLQLMVDNPPAKADAPLIKDMESIGMKVGEKFSTEGLSPELVKELNEIPEAAHQNWIDKSTGKKDAGVPIVNNWLFATKNMGTYGTDYEQRAFVAFIGLGANLPADAVYPSTSRDSEGNPTVGTNKYVLHFDKDGIPPVNAFWSLTAYNSKDFLVKNPINRFAIGDRDKLKFNKDGSLDIYIQNSDPGRDKTANWLPSTQEGLTNLTLRIYWPKESVLDGTWEVPGIKKVD
ncbi:hypothetical protein MNBD_IGNAVI01-1193 [hydrothermal vent metagenome]|uniref:DUF1254 domain-containing protein n=1 Tax=hydrothermal vent metagenome TaxID=652676 RepID=A0A3B1C0U4_9ZZZZ